jgi:hypothetical protein
LTGLTATFVALLFGGIVMLGRARGPAWLRFLGRGLSAALALGFAWLTIALIRFGEGRGWTGDGPALLVVMLAIPVAALCALAMGVGAFLPATVTARAPAWLAIGSIAVGLAGTGWSALEMRRAARPSHGAPVVALAFVDGGSRLVSYDANGGVKRWRIRTQALEREWQAPELAGARAILSTLEGFRALALFEGRAVVHTFEKGTRTVTLPGVGAAALLPGDRAVLAAGRTLRVAPLAAPQQPDLERELPAEARALAADRQGRIWAALADGALVALDGGNALQEIARLPGPAERLLVSPGGSWLAAIEAGGKGRVIAAATGAVHDVPGFGVHAAAFASERLFLFNSGPLDGAALAFSLERLVTEPWIGQGVGIAALAVDPDAGVAAFAAGNDANVLVAPGKGNAYTSKWDRLSDRGAF